MSLPCQSCNDPMHGVRTYEVRKLCDQCGGEPAYDAKQILSSRIAKREREAKAAKKKHRL